MKTACVGRVPVWGRRQTFCQEPGAELPSCRLSCWLRPTLQVSSSMSFRDARKNWGEEERKRVSPCPWPGPFPHPCVLGCCWGELLEWQCLPCQAQPSFHQLSTTLSAPSSPRPFVTPRGCCTLSTCCSHSAESRELSALPRKQEEAKALLLLKLTPKKSPVVSSAVRPPRNPRPSGWKGPTSACAKALARPQTQEGAQGCLSEPLHSWWGRSH